jgi:hypothetical protein
MFQKKHRLMIDNDAPLLVAKASAACLPDLLIKFSKEDIGIWHYSPASFVRHCSCMRLQLRRISTVVEDR